MTLRTVRNRVQRVDETRILILGLDNAGKTTILNQLDGSGGSLSTTQSFNMRRFEYRGHTINCCDVGGQRGLREYWRDYFATDLLLFVVDSCDRRRLEESREAFADVLEGLCDVPVLVLANKQDLHNAQSPTNVATALKLEENGDRPWHIQGCSAKSGNGINEGMDWILSIRKVKYNL